MMHPSSLRVPFFAAISLGTAVHCAAQTPPSPAPQASVTPGSGRAAAADDTALAGLPSFLLLVPAGPVQMGLEAEMLVTAACQAALPSKPEIAAEVSKATVGTNMKRSVSVLGMRTVHQPAFLLAKLPITNGQYLAFFEAQRAAGKKVRPPFHWWRIGCREDYDKKLPEIATLFPGDKLGGVNYWERFGDKLPYKLQDEKGKPIHDLPVTYVSWRDANACAGWLGMRLMTEVEFTRAARGDGKHLWPTAKPGDAASDRYTEQTQKELRIFSTSEKVLKPVGTVPSACGPFGHGDLFGSVWQFVSDLGYRPINGHEPFAAEWKTLQKNKIGQLVTNAPDWRSELCLTKGGSYLSGNEPMQLLIDARAPVETHDVLESAGFRVAKSLKPGYDALFSALRGTFSKVSFADEQDVALDAQVGAERYELDAKGFPTRYETITFAPVNWLSRERNVELGKLIDRSQTKPVLIGVMMTTDTLAMPAAKPGAYSVHYRKAGVPRELVDAVKQGHKEVIAAAKQKPADKDEEQGEGKEPKKDKDAKKQEKKGWREVVAQYGLTEKDLAEKHFAEGTVPFVRIEGVEVPADEDALLLQDSEGKFAAAWKAPNAKPAAGNPVASTLALEANDKGKAIAKFVVASPLSQANEKRVGLFHVHFVLDREAPAADKPWRLPTAAAAGK
jgi:formylglycine-generating enzyme required for sulfatase activity